MGSRRSTPRSPSSRRSALRGGGGSMRKRSAGCLAEEITTPGQGQVKAIISVASNPVLSAPNGPQLAAALEQLDLMISVDIYLNETTQHADVILPGLSPLEDVHYDVAFPQLSWRNTVRFSPAVLPRPADQPAEWQIVLRPLALAPGKGARADLAGLDAQMAAAAA